MTERQPRAISPRENTVLVAVEVSEKTLNWKTFVSFLNDYSTIELGRSRSD